MSNEKTYVFTPNEGSLSSIIAPLLQQRGIDPNILLAMRNNGNGWSDGSMFWWVIFLFFLMGWGNNGWGGNRNTPELANQLNNDYGRDLLMQAIQGNANAISQLASNLNCSVGNIQTAINSVQTQICQVGNQVGMSGQQIINSIQNCDVQCKAGWFHVVRAFCNLIFVGSASLVDKNVADKILFRRRRSALH